MTVLITNARVVDATGERPGLHDVLLEGGRVARIVETSGAGFETLAALAPQPTTMVDAGGRLLMPGFVDAHSHADAAVFVPEVQLALLRQGVTTVIGGQDGVGFAPGDGVYGTEYFAAINGPHPHYAGGGIAGLLAGYDGATALNVATLVPAGTVRFAVMGRSTASPTRAELDEMRDLVASGLDDGAAGLSTGLDYVPGVFADAAELAELTRPVADAGGVYVSHMRGGYEANSAAGIDEIAAIAAAGGVRVHVSHFHAEPGIVRDQLARLAAAGVDASFDAYPYTRGCSILAMPILPAELTVRPADEVVAVLADPASRRRLRRDWFPTITGYASLGPDWPAMLTLAHVAAPEYDWAHGLTLAEGAVQATRRTGVDTDAIDFALDVLVASRLEVNVVMAVQHERSDDELAAILSLPSAIGGSDGIFLGRHPHPRARGSFARYLSLLVREQGAMSWPDAAALVSARAAERFGLGDRGVVREGAIADLVLVDPSHVGPRAAYDAPLGLAEGIDDVFVAGVPVLAGGELTGATPGMGLRRSTNVSGLRSEASRNPGSGFETVAALPPQPGSGREG
ncbi:amidohydrolase family protein [Agromyces endophyticus]|uniref:N-acyl-D-amino-acid deacylase family protein n=1 Tax=Agromyces sp. H17E-10 TaxID=2932244 RepID=UPI001FD10523|nr:amidohydrolase family protein [Agromyces sp. H17E-10]UOQ89978.1 amidohydrolase family protein [Agromyces sp. H17E-10]